MVRSYALLSDGKTNQVYVDESFFVFKQASLALNTTDKGPEKPLLQCTSVKSWSGGDLYVKVTPGLIVPVDYTLNIEVVPSNTPSTDRIVENTPYQVSISMPWSCTVILYECLQL